MKIMKSVIFALASLSTSAVIPQTEYLFHQQLNDMCMIAPMLNLPILEQLETENYQSKTTPYYTRREWFVLNHPFLRAWHEGLSDEINKDGLLGGEPSPLYIFAKQAVNEGPIMPHFYDANGKFSFTGTKGAKNFTQVPFAFYDINALERVKIKLFIITLLNLRKHIPFMGIKVPFVKDGKDYKVLYPVKVDGRMEIHEDVIRDPESLEWLAAEIEPFKPPYFKYLADSPLMKILDNPRYQNMHTLPWLGLIKLKKPQLGFSAIATSIKLGSGYVHEGNNYVPYFQGLYKLLLLALGLDTNNDQLVRDGNVISDKNDGDDVVPVMKTIQKLINNDPNNPWHPSRFSIDKFLQYEITEVLKENEELFEEAKQTVDFFLTPWSLFEDLKYRQKFHRYIDGNLTPYTTEMVKRYIPGDMQALAYMISQAVRLLWLGAMSKKVFYKETSQWIPLFWSWGSYKKAAKKEKRIHDRTKVSFLSTWSKLIDKLHERWNRHGITRRHWITFDSHGYVTSFEPELIAIQSGLSGIHDKELLARLRIAIIESDHSTDLPVFYKRKRTEKKEDEALVTKEEEEEEEESEEEAIPTGKEEKP